MSTIFAIGLVFVIVVHFILEYRREQRHLRRFIEEHKEKYERLD